MAVYQVQRFIYRNLVKRPQVAQALDKLGDAINKGLQAAGLSQRYATGLTRNKAALHASGSTEKAKEAGRALIASGRARALKEVRSDLRQSFHLPYSVKEVEKAGGLSLAQAHDLIWKIWEGTAFDNQPSFRTLLPALEASKKSGKTPERTADLIGRVIDNCGSFTSFAFEALPAVVEAKFTADQIVETFGSIAKYSYSYGKTWTGLYCPFGSDPEKMMAWEATDAAIKAVRSLIAKNMPPEQIVALLREKIGSARQNYQVTDAYRFFLSICANQKAA